MRIHTPTVWLTSIFCFISLAGKAQAQPAAPLQLSAETDYADYPSMIPAPNGDVFVAWVSYDQKGADEVRMRRRHSGTWEQPISVTPEPGDYFKTALAIDKSGRVWVSWAARVNDNFDLYARAFANGKWSGVTRLTIDPQPDFHHAMAADTEGNVYISWQSFRTGDANIYLKVFDGKRWSNDIPITAHAANDWEPALALDAHNRLYIVYDTYRHGDYDVYLRVYDHGKLSGETPIASSPNFEARATVACDREGRAWIAWDDQGPGWGLDKPVWNLSSKTGDWGAPPAWSRGILADPAALRVSIRNSQRIGMAVYQDGNLWTPKTRLEDALPRELADSFEIPHLTLDGQGVPWLIFRHYVSWGAGGPREAMQRRPGGWAIYATAYRGSSWTPPVRLSESTGSNDQRVATAVDRSGRLSIAYPADGRLRGDGKGIKNQDERHGRIFFSNVETPAGVPAELAALKPAVERPYRHTAPAGRRNTVAAGGKRYQLYWGDLHRHTEISVDGGYDGTLWDMYRYALDAAELDFVATTDHTYGGSGKGNLTTYDWWRTQKLADLFHVRGKFMPLFGYERSLLWPYGHRNVINLKRGTTALAATIPASAQNQDSPRQPEEMRLWEALRGQDVITIPHTIAIVHGTDWTFNNPALEPLLEIYQGCRMSYETKGAPRVAEQGDHPEGYAQRPLEKGYKIGFISSSDHRSTHISYAAVYAESPSREGIFRALQQRHAYAATDNIVVDFRIGDAILGDAIITEQIPDLRIMVRGTAPIHQIEVIKNNQHLYTSEARGHEVSFTFRDQSAQPGESYYYVRVQQEDGQMAWASPIWVNYQPR